MEQEQDGGCTIPRFGAWEQEIKSWIGQWFSLGTQKVIPQQGLALKGHWLKEVPHQTRMTGKLPNIKTNKQTNQKKKTFISELAEFCSDLYMRQLCRPERHNVEEVMESNCTFREQLEPSDVWQDESLWKEAPRGHCVELGSWTLSCSGHPRILVWGSEEALRECVKECLHLQSTLWEPSFNTVTEKFLSL